MTDVQLTNVITMGISATLPATYDSIGYGAVIFTDIGEVIDVGEVAKAYNMTKHQSVTRRYPQNLKGTYDIGEVSVNLGEVTADGGQVLIQTALDADASYSIEIVSAGVSQYFTAQVSKAGSGPIAADGVATTVVTLVPDAETAFEE